MLSTVPMTRPMPFVRFSLKRIVLMASRNARAFAAVAELTPARADMLIALLHAELGVAQRDLVHTFGITAPVVSRMVRALETLGFVSRRVCPRDRRVRLVSITDKGRKALDVLFDGWMADTGEALVQANAEQDLLDEWNDPLADKGIHLTMPLFDAGPFLRHMRATLLSTEYWEHTFDREDAKKLRAFRNSKRAA